MSLSVGIALAVFGAILFASSPSRADESPLTGNIEIQGGPYYPSVDEEFSGDTAPFRENFGGKDRVLFDALVEYYVWTGHGKLGVGGGVGYAKFQGNNTIADDDSESDSEGESLEINESQNFAIFPFRVGVSYRWDFLDEEFGIPLSPKIEGGFDYVIWRVKDDSGSIPTVDGEKARNGTFGWHASAALELNLGVIAPRAAARFDQQWGVNDTYLFGGYEIRQIDGFGSASGFDLSDQGWKVGLAFQF